jgi:hypothetical protein
VRSQVRLQTDTFTGLAAMHCHYLVHEDQGMLATVAIEGAEGTTYADAQTIDPSCYVGATPSAWERVRADEVPPWTVRAPYSARVRVAGNAFEAAIGLGLLVATGVLVQTRVRAVRGGAGGEGGALL